MLHRYKNSLAKSFITAVITFCGKDCGTMGPRFAFQDKNGAGEDMPLHFLADFLNDTTGKNGSARIISKYIEKRMIKDFFYVLKFKAGRYHYIGPVSPGSYASYRSFMEDYREQESLLNFVKTIGQKESAGNFTDEEAQAVIQHEIAITDSNSSKPILGSYGAGPCIIIACYNPTTKIAALAHVDALTTLSSLDVTFNRISTLGNKLQIHLAGGDNNSKKLAADLINRINSRSDTEIVSANICSGNRAKRLAIDSRTGEIFTGFSTDQLKHEENFKLKLRSLGFRFEKFPIINSFDGTILNKTTTTVQSHKLSKKENKSCEKNNYFKYNLKSFCVSDVLSAFEYNSIEQQLALTKMAAFTGCFGETYIGKLMSDAQAKQLLDKDFESLEAGIHWWCDVTQQCWLRKSFHREEISKDKNPVLNLQRWSDDNFSRVTAESNQFTAMFKSLGLIDPVSWPEYLVAHVVVFGSLEEHVRERLSCIPDFTGTLYYTTNPRGLFNHEPSLAAILARWFDKPEVESIIQAVLDKHIDPNLSDKHWLKDIEGLKQEILNALGETTWPINKGWYYKNPQPFEEAAKREGRRSIAGWPTSMDMVEYLLEQRKLNEPGLFKKAKLCPVYCVGEKRLPGAADQVKKWYEDYGRSLADKERVVFVSNNSKYFHAIPFQHTDAQETLRNIEKTPAHLSDTMLTVGPGAGLQEVSLPAALDSYAKIFYAKRQRILKAITEKKDTKEQHKNIAIPNYYLPKKYVSTSYESIRKQLPESKCRVRSKKLISGKKMEKPALSNVEQTMSEVIAMESRIPQLQTVVQLEHHHTTSQATEDLEKIVQDVLEHLSSSFSNAHAAKEDDAQIDDGCCSMTQ